MAREAKVLITSENKAQQGIKAATQDLLGFGEAAKSIGDKIQNAFTVLAIAKAAKEVMSFGVDAVKAFGDVERKMTQLKTALGGNEQSFAKLTDHISKLSSQTLASKGDVQSLVAQLAALGKSDADIQRISSAAVHLSNVTGQGLNEAMKQVNATFSGSTDELGKLVPELKGLTKEQLAAGAAVDTLNTKFGGLSNQMAAGVGQSLKNLTDSFDGLKQSAGESLARAFAPFISALDSVVTKIAESIEAYNKLKTAQDDIANNSEKAKDQSKLIVAEATLVTARAKYESARSEYDAYGGDAKKNYLDKEIKAHSGKRDANSLELVASLRQELAPLQAMKASVEKYAAEVKSAINTIDTVRLDMAAKEKSGVNERPENKPAAPLPPPPALKSGESLWELWIGGLGDDVINKKWDRFYTEQEGNVSTGNNAVGQYAHKDLSVMGGDMDPLALLFDSLGGAITGIVDRFGGLLGSLGSVQAIMDPLGTILAGVMEVLGPLIDEALTPIVGILKVFGNIIGQTLTPILNILTPIIRGIADMFIWFGNKVIVPVAGFIIGIFNGIASLLNKIPGVNIKLADTPQAITLTQVNAAGSATVTKLGGSDSGSNTNKPGGGATYTGSRPITFNFYNQGNVVGSGGMEELAAIIGSLIKRNERYA